MRMGFSDLLVLLRVAEESIGNFWIISRKSGRSVASEVAMMPMPSSKTVVMEYVYKATVHPHI